MRFKHLLTIAPFFFCLAACQAPRQFFLPLEYLNYANNSDRNEFWLNASQVDGHPAKANKFSVETYVAFDASLPPSSKQNLHSHLTLSCDTNEFQFAGEDARIAPKLSAGDIILKKICGIKLGEEKFIFMWHVEDKRQFYASFEKTTFDKKSNTYRAVVTALPENSYPGDMTEENNFYTWKFSCNSNSVEIKISNRHEVGAKGTFDREGKTYKLNYSDSPLTQRLCKNAEKTVNNVRASGNEAVDECLMRGYKPGQTLFSDCVSGM